MERSLFEQMVRTYRQVGDYFLPNLELPDEPEVEIGVWVERRRRYLRDHKYGIYTGMLITDKLNAHLAEIDKQATDMCEGLIKRFAKLECINEKLKAEDQMAWVRAMNSIKNQVEEIVRNDLIVVSVGIGFGKIMLTI